MPATVSVLLKSEVFEDLRIRLIDRDEFMAGRAILRDGLPGCRHALPIVAVKTREPKVFDVPILLVVA